MIDADLIIAFLVAITLLAAVARRIGTPYPVVLVLGGLVMGLIPGVPSARLRPDLVLVLFLPPLLYSAAYLSSVRELRANAGPILLLAVGLVLATVGGIALFGALVIGLPWAVAFVLGAVLGPTDPVSASAILQRTGAPSRIVTILEGESLVNDGTAITAYTIAVAAVQTGHFSIGHAIWKFSFEVAVGTLIGLAAAWLATRVRRRLEAGAELTLTLLTPFIAYVPAQEAGASGVLAAVAAGLYVATQAPRVSSPGARLQLASFWQMLVFLLNAILFLLIGLQLPKVLDGIRGGLSLTLAWQALALAAAVFAIRFLWMGLMPIVQRALRRGRGATSAGHPTRLVLGWAGMRGALSLAIALAVPLETSAGAPFPGREELVFFTYAAVLLTLVPPGFTLGPLVRRLGLERAEERAQRLAEARSSVYEAALERIDSLLTDHEVDEELAGRLRHLYEGRVERLAARIDGEADGGDGTARHARARRAVIAAERDRLAELGAAGSYPADLLREIQHELDLEEARIR